MPNSKLLYLAPRHVYAGILSNKTNKSIYCTIHYRSKLSDESNETISVTMDAGSRAFIPEREYRPSPDATFTCRKIVSRIDVRANEQTFSLVEPFDGVICPVTEWQFNVHDEYIASVNPNLQQKIISIQ